MLLDFLSHAGSNWCLAFSIRTPSSLLFVLLPRVCESLEQLSKLFRVDPTCSLTSLWLLYTGSQRTGLQHRLRLDPHAKGTQPFNSSFQCLFDDFTLGIWVGIGWTWWTRSPWTSRTDWSNWSTRHWWSHWSSWRRWTARFSRTNWTARTAGTAWLRRSDRNSRAARTCWFQGLLLLNSIIFSWYPFSLWSVLNLRSFFTSFIY